MPAYRYGYMHMCMWSQKGATDPQKQGLQVDMSLWWVLETEPRAFGRGASTPITQPCLQSKSESFNIHNYLQFE